MIASFLTSSYGQFPFTYKQKIARQPQILNNPSFQFFGFPGGKGMCHPRKQCKTKATRAGPSSKLPDSLAPKKN